MGSRFTHTVHHAERSLAEKISVYFKQGMMIDSIEKAHGCEIPLVLYSTVRTNSRSALGFVKDFRRLNVSITRAQKGCIIFGDVSTLFHGDVDDWWRHYFWYADKNRLLLDEHLYALPLEGVLSDSS